MLKVLSHLRLPVLALVWVAAACAVANPRLDAYRALSPETRELYDRYRQFMTDSQQERFFGALRDEERQAIVTDMHVEEKLAKYPAPVRDAIWSRQVLPGMDKEAVFYAAGRPTAIVRPAFGEPGHGDRETWLYERGTGREDFQVVIEQGVVKSVEKSR